MCFASTPSAWARMRASSAASRARSLIDPRLPSVWGWCSTTRAWGSSERFPGAPAASRIAEVEVAWPTQSVATSGETNCMVS